MLTDIFVTRIWGTANEGEKTYTVDVYLDGSQTVTTVVAISKMEFTDEDDHAWIKVDVKCYYDNEGGHCPTKEPDPLDTVPASYRLKIVKPTQIIYELKVRNDDGFIYADCPIMIFFHSK
jgi:hypothetical protein